MNMLYDWWLQWRAHRENVRQGRAFLRLPHDKHDPECVLWDAETMDDWAARCPSCNPVPVHYVDPALGGSSLHAFVDVSAPAEWTRERGEVTCPICLGVLLSRETARPELS